jgi:hypothetical protein
VTGDGADTAEQVAWIWRLACSRYCFVLDSNAAGQRDKGSAWQLQGLLESRMGTRIAAAAGTRRNLLKGRFPPNCRHLRLPGMNRDVLYARKAREV